MVYTYVITKYCIIQEGLTYRVPKTACISHLHVFIGSKFIHDVMVIAKNRDQGQIKNDYTT